MYRANTHHHGALTGIFMLLVPSFVLAMAPIEVDPNTFFKQSAQEQQDFIWHAVEASAYQVLPEQDQAPPKDLALLARSENLVKVFQYSSIVLPEGRRKATHQFGTVAKVEFEAQPGSRAYTGLFRSGGLGILRLSLAKANPAADGHQAYIPNLSLKLLRDANPDTNILAMHSIEGLGKDPNFFSHSFSNFPGPGITVPLRLLSGWFENALGEYTQDWSQIHERAQVMPLAESSLLAKDGSQAAAPHAPYEVIFIPNPKFYRHFQERIQALRSVDEQQTMKALDFRRLLAEAPFDAGEVLFEVYARDHKEARQLWEEHWGGWLKQLKAWWKADGYYQEEQPGETPPQSERIGRLVLRSRCLASAFGDQLPFRHPTLHEVVAPEPPGGEP
jgi:hypothetical protein